MNNSHDRAGACWSVPAIVHADAAAQHWHSVLRQQRGVQPSIGKVAESIARPGLAGAPAPLQEFRPAGVPNTRVTDYDNGWDIPSATIGGVARLQDMCTAGDGERLHRLEGASSFAYDGDVGRGVHGGWVPAEPAGVDSAACVGDHRVHRVGFREGSAQWRRHAAAAADRDEARGLMRAEHERAARYFGRKDEAAEVVEAAEARATLKERERGAVATDRHRRASVNPVYCAADATIPALCMAHALVGRLRWLLVLSDDAAAAADVLSARALLAGALRSASYLRPWLFTLPRVEEEAVLLPGRGCVLHGGTVNGWTRRGERLDGQPQERGNMSGWTRREVGKRTGNSGDPIHFVEATCDSNECRKLPMPERSTLDEAACLGPVAHLDDPRVNMGAAWPQARGSRYGSRAPAFVLSYGALHVLMGGDPTSVAAGMTMVEAPDGSGRLMPKPPNIFPRHPAQGVVKHALKPCLGRLLCPFGAEACATRPAQARSRVTGACDVRRDQRDDCRSCGDGMHAQVACCLALAGVYATYS